MAIAMQVYVELALAENFCMDFTLLVCARYASKNRCSYKRVALASLLGACFAVLFPLTGIGGFWATAIKIAAGLLLCAVCAGFKKPAVLLKFALFFTAFTFLLGGALIALFSFFEVEYEEGGGFILSKIPIGIPLFFGLMLLTAVKKIARKFISKNAKIEVRCNIYMGESMIELNGFFDSGNKVFYKGQPVSVISEENAKKIIDVSCITEGVKIHTVAGSKSIKIFTADKIVIYNGEVAHTIEHVKIGISPAPVAGAVLHPDLSED